MIRPIPWLRITIFMFAVGGCSPEAGSKTRLPDDDSHLSPAQREAQTLGREIYDLIDRAIDYRGSHMGRPAATLRMMGGESLTPTTVRRVVNVQREPLVTVAFRRTAGRAILSCYGDSKILEDVALHGRFTITCTSSSGDKRPIEVGAALDP
jgi:hypothetical protein